MLKTIIDNCVPIIIKYAICTPVKTEIREGGIEIENREFNEKCSNIYIFFVFP